MPCRIHLDGCLARIGYTLSWADKITNRLSTCTGVTPSGVGLHLLFDVRQAAVAALREEGLLKTMAPRSAKVGNKFLPSTKESHDGPFADAECNQIGVVQRADLVRLLGEFEPPCEAEAGDRKFASGGDKSGSGIASRVFADRFTEGVAKRKRLMPSLRTTVRLASGGARG